MNKIWIKNNYIKLFVTVFIVCSLLLVGLRLKIGGGISGGDSIRYYSYLKTVALDHNFDFERQFDYYRQTKSEFTGRVKYSDARQVNSITGRDIMLYPIGTTIFWYPFFIFGHFFASIFAWLSGNAFYLSGFSMIHYYFVSLSALFYALLASYWLYVYLAKQPRFSRQMSFLAVATIVLGSSLTYYIYFLPTYSHSLSFFSVTIFLLYFLKMYNRKRYDKWNLFVLGLLSAMVYLIRYQDILVGIIPAYVLLTDVFCHKDYSFWRAYRKWPYFIIGVFLLLLPQLLVNKYLHGAYLSSGYSAYGFDYWLHPKILFSLFDIHKGAFVLTPIVAVAIGGLLWKIKERLNQAYLLFFLLEIYAISAWSFYHQGESYGSRMSICCSVVYIFGLLPVLERLYKIKPWLPWLVSVLFVILNWLLMSLFAFRIIGTPYGSAS